MNCTMFLKLIQFHFVYVDFYDNRMRLSNIPSCDHHKVWSTTCNGCSHESVSLSCYFNDVSMQSSSFQNVQ